MSEDVDFRCLVCGLGMPQEQLVCGCGWRRTLTSDGATWVVERREADLEGKGGGSASWVQVPRGLWWFSGVGLGEGDFPDERSRTRIRGNAGMVPVRL